MNFQNTNGLFFILAALALAATCMVIYYGKDRRRRRLRLLGKPKMVARLSQDVSGRKRWLRSVLFFFGLFFLLLAAARPWWGKRLTPYPEQSRDVLIAIDVSRSMLAVDVEPSRLVHAKWLAQEIINRMRGDRFGIIAFAGDAFLECPLTQDRHTLFSFLEDLDTNTMPIGGTNIAAALGAARDAFEGAEGAHKAVFLITDGDELQGNARAEVDSLSRQQIPLIIAGVGTAGHAVPIQLQDGEYLRDQKGELVSTRLNEKILNDLAQQTDGLYVHSTTVSPRVDSLAGRLSALVPEQSEKGKTMRPIERFQIPLAIGLILLAARLFVGETRHPPQADNRGAVTLLLIVLLAPGYNQSAHFRPEADMPAGPSVELCTGMLASQSQAFTLFNVSRLFNVIDSNAALAQAQAGDNKILKPAENIGSERPTKKLFGASPPLQPPGKQQLSKAAEAKLKEQIRKMTQQAAAEQGEHRARAYYNKGWAHQQLGQMKEAQKAYNKAMDNCDSTSLVYTWALWNLGMINHLKARKLMAEEPEKALAALTETRDFYREALRNKSALDTVSPELSRGLSVNLELALHDRKLAQSLQQFRDSYKALLTQARQQVTDAIDNQKLAIDAASSAEKRQYIEAAHTDTLATVSTIGKLRELFESLPWELLKDPELKKQSRKINEAAEETERAEILERRSLYRIWRNEVENELLAMGLNHLRKAAALLGVAEETQTPKDHKPQNTDANQPRDNQAKGQQPQEAENGDKRPGNQKRRGNQPTGMAQDLEDIENSVPEEQPDEIPQTLDENQARALLMKMMEREKDFRNALKEYRRRQMGDGEVEKNW